MSMYMHFGISYRNHTRGACRAYPYVFPHIIPMTYSDRQKACFFRNLHQNICINTILSSIEKPNPSQPSVFPLISKCTLVSLSFAGGAHVITSSLFCSHGSDSMKQPLMMPHSDRSIVPVNGCNVVGGGAC